MNKKLLFAAMSLAALTACTNDDFDSQNVAEKVSPIQFEVINNAETRAAMGGANGNTLVWNANDNDLFTLYHGAAAGEVTGFENAIYKANADEAGATLTTPSMIKEGRAIMVWPVDTTFRIKAADKLTITIPDVQIPNEKHKDIADIIPYVSDLVNIGAYAAYNEKTGTDYNKAGYSRKYPVYMRPMASQLTLKADYGDTENELKKLYDGGTDPLINGDPITPIKVSSVSLKTGDATKFTKTIPVKWTDPGDVNTAGTIAYQWAHATGKNEKNAWEKVTDYDVANIATAGSGGVQVNTLTSKCLVGNESSKFLILPQANMAGAVADGAIEIETYYGKVLIANADVYTAEGTPAAFRYSAEEYNAAWYRYISEAKDADTWENASGAKITTGEFADKYKVVARSTALGMAQTINSFSSHVAGSGLTKGEPCGYSLTRYLNVDLSKLNMSGLHIKDDKQLRDVARVWKKLNLGAVTVYLDGGSTGKFTITQKTIDIINSVEPTGNVEPTFKVKPCQDVYVPATGEHGVCTQIVITENSGNATVKDVDFIAKGDGDQKVDVVLANETTAWNWAGTVKVDETAVSKFINLGTMTNAADATLKTAKANGDANNVKLENDGTWNINDNGTVIFVQFDVTNNGTVNIAKGAEYRQSGAGHIFTNDATTLEKSFLDDPDDEQVGKVINEGVFATVNGGEIYNYGLIEHADKDAKTYISANQTTPVDFRESFGAANKMGRINLPYDNKDEDNISVTHALEQGFVSVTVNNTTAAPLNADVVGAKVNYVIVKSGVTEIQAISGQVKYLEINQPGTELAWNVPAATNYVGLMVLSDVNIKLGTSITATSTYLHKDATMYVGGTFNNPGTDTNMYFGNTGANFTTNYVTY